MFPQRPFRPHAATIRPPRAARPADVLVGPFLLLTATVLLACGEAPTALPSPDGPDSPPPETVEPAVPPWLVVSEARAADGAPSEVAFVSGRPGGLPYAVEVRIRNVTAGGSVDVVELEGGGFGPVAVSASIGDTLELTHREQTGFTRTVIATVPAERAPVILGTSIAPNARNVLVRSRVRIVFSEPMDEASLAGTVRLSSRAGSAEGAVLLADTPWVAEVVRQAPLEPAMNYELSVSSGVRDRWGEPLAAAAGSGQIPSTVLTVKFTTEGAVLGMTAPGRIAFVSTRDGAPHVYLVNPDATDLERLTPGEAPAWAPDGRRIAFQTGPDAGSAPGPREIHVIDVSSGGRWLVARDAAWPAWSPDGRRIAFVRNGDIFVTNADGSGQTTRFISTQVRASLGLREGSTRLDWPAWSPDGQRIAFTADGQLYVAHADGTSPRALHLQGSGWTDARPAWSPDGSRIAISAGPGMDPMRWIVSASPGEAHPRYHEQGLAPHWSPDGLWFVYHRPIDWDAYFGNPCCTRIYIVSSGNSPVPKRIAPAATDPVDPLYSDYDAVWTYVRE